MSKMEMCTVFVTLKIKKAAAAPGSVGAGAPRAVTYDRERTTD